MQFRQANTHEIDDLNLLIRSSKSFWKYSSDFLDSYIKKWGLNEDYMANNYIAVLEEQQSTYGLWSFSNDDEEPVLDNFFLHPAYIGQGLGKFMWQHVIAYATAQDWHSFQLLSDPNAEIFYEHMGAKKIGDYESHPGRFVPIMRKHTIIPLQ